MNARPFILASRHIAAKRGNFQDFLLLEEYRRMLNHKRPFIMPHCLYQPCDAPVVVACEPGAEYLDQRFYVPGPLAALPG